MLILKSVVVLLMKVMKGFLKLICVFSALCVVCPFKNVMASEVEVILPDLTEGVVQCRTKKARERQEKRKNGEGIEFRFLSQRLTAYIEKLDVGKNYNLATPFGKVVLDIRNKKDIYVKLIGEDIKTKYSDLCCSIENVLNEKGQKKLAEEIDRYLRMLPEEYVFMECSNFFGYTSEGKKKNTLINKDYFKEQGLKSADIKLAEKSAAILSAILFVSEPGPNRAFDGGKLERASLQYIIKDKKTFKDVYVGNPTIDGKDVKYETADDMPLYSPAIKSGTAAIRSISIGKIPTNLEIKICDKFAENILKLENDCMSDDSDTDEGEVVEESEEIPTIENSVES